jgi:hypothetical protein
MMAEVASTPDEATQHTVGFFTTRVVQRLSDGRQLVSHSRWVRIFSMTTNGMDSSSPTMWHLSARLEVYPTSQAREGVHQ